MHILIVNRSPVPVFAYGGTERVIWDLARALTQMGHKVTFLVPEGSHCDFARVLVLDKKKPLKPQIPRDVDLVHFQFQPEFDLDTDFDMPYLMTEHGNYNKNVTRPLNTVFVSRDHAQRHHSEQFVYNGLNWDSYGAVDFIRARTHFHFLGKAAWRVKNVVGAIKVAQMAKVTLAVLGGSRLNLSRGFRFTFTPRAQFYGMVGGQQKFDLLNGSRGFIFPVMWEEPFGLAMIESLFFGAPVYGFPSGSLPEMIVPEVGYLSASRSLEDLAQVILDRGYDAKICHEYARDMFNSKRMALGYLETFEKILNGNKLNPIAPYLKK